MGGGAGPLLWIDAGVWPTSLLTLSYRYSSVLRPREEGPQRGPPGKHVVQGKAKYRLIDERVQYFVSPGAATLESTQVSGGGSTWNLVPLIIHLSYPCHRRRHRHLCHVDLRPDPADFPS